MTGAKAGGRERDRKGKNARRNFSSLFLASKNVKRTARSCAVGVACCTTRFVNTYHSLCPRSTGTSRNGDGEETGAEKRTLNSFLSAFAASSAGPLSPFPFPGRP